MGQVNNIFILFKPTMQNEFLISFFRPDQTKQQQQLCFLKRDLQPYLSLEMDGFAVLKNTHFLCHFWAYKRPAQLSLWNLACYWYNNTAWYSAYTKLPNLFGGELKQERKISRFLMMEQMWRNRTENKVIIQLVKKHRGKSKMHYYNGWAYVVQDLTYSYLLTLNSYSRKIQILQYNNSN